MRMKLALGNDVSLEILFLECSRPVADVSKFLLDWVKLVRMCRDAHVRMFQNMTTGKKFWGCAYINGASSLP